MRLGFIDVADVFGVVFRALSSVFSPEEDLYREFFHQDEDMPQKVPLMQLAFKTDANLDGGKLRSDLTTLGRLGCVGMMTCHQKKPPKVMRNAVKRMRNPGINKTEDVCNSVLRKLFMASLERSPNSILPGSGI